MIHNWNADRIMENNNESSIDDIIYDLTKKLHNSVDVLSDNIYAIKANREEKLN